MIGFQTATGKKSICLWPALVCSEVEVNKFRREEEAVVQGREAQAKVKASNRYCPGPDFQLGTVSMYLQVLSDKGRLSVHVGRCSADAYYSQSIGPRQTWSQLSSPPTPKIGWHAAHTHLLLQKPGQLSPLVLCSFRRGEP